jgi:hypothetical protein
MADHEIDPVIVDFVEQVANRFGAPGLDELITLAQERLVVARKALEELGHLDE